MAHGRLGVAELAANNPVSIYEVPQNTLYADLNITLLNPSATDAVAAVAVAATASPNANEYIEKGVVIPASGGTVHITGVFVSPGEHIIVSSAVAGVVVRVDGKEVVKV